MTRMKPNPNGHSKITIVATQLADGWVYFNTSDPRSDELPNYLNKSLVDWLKAHPNAKPRATLPIIAEGDLIAIHLWFD